VKEFMRSTQRLLLSAVHPTVPLSGLFSVLYSDREEGGARVWRR
jgi:hypothetical protein